MSFGTAVASIELTSQALDLTTKAEERASAQSRSLVYLELRNRFSAIKAELDSISETEWLPVYDLSSWRAYEQYWQNAFDEWATTTQFGGGHVSELWTEFYEGILSDVVRLYRPLRYVACWLTEPDGEFGPLRPAFRSTLDTLNGASICDPDFPAPDSETERAAA